MDSGRIVDGQHQLPVGWQKRTKVFRKWLLIGVVVLLALIWPVTRIADHILDARRDGQRIDKIAGVLQQHPVNSLLAGQKFVANNRSRIPAHMAVAVAANCQIKTDANATGNTVHSFVYLLEDKSPDDHCDVQHLTALYGKPNSSVVIDGNIEQPRVILLFYDKGAYKPVLQPKNAETTDPATVVPISLEELAQRRSSQFHCTSTTVNIVAHQDDDLLFLSPDILHDVQSGKCVRTIFLTAGDAGAKEYYWLGREHGSQLAYSAMTAESDDLWIQRIIKLKDKEFVRITTPRENPRISLVYFRLPDGGLQGKGFSGDSYQSASKLLSGSMASLTAVDGQSSFTASGLTEALTELMRFYAPDTVRSQSTRNILSKNPYIDHADHVAAGHFAKNAFQAYGHGTLALYYGYPVHGMPANLSVADHAQKEQIFLTYGQSDTGVCHTTQECSATATYNSYLWRQYSAPQ